MPEASRFTLQRCGQIFQIIFILKPQHEVNEINNLQFSQVDDVLNVHQMMICMIVSICHGPASSGCHMLQKCKFLYFFLKLDKITIITSAHKKIKAYIFHLISNRDLLS